MVPSLVRCHFSPIIKHLLRFSDICPPLPYTQEQSHIYMTHTCTDTQPARDSIDIQRDCKTLGGGDSTQPSSVNESGGKTMSSMTQLSCRLDPIE